MLAAYTAFPISAFAFDNSKKLRIVLVGTGVRGTSFFGGKDLLKNIQIFSNL